jgi:hypothetical protein
VGLHHYPDIQALADADVRAAVELRCLQLGRQLLKLRRAAAAAAADYGCGAQALGAGAAGGVRTIQQVVQLVRTSVHVTAAEPRRRQSTGVFCHKSLSCNTGCRPS